MGEASGSDGSGMGTPAAEREYLRHRSEAINELPAMPEMARRLLILRSNPYADVDDLARVVEMDPSLSAQIIRYARSPFFSYRGEVISVQSAISRVLGYEPVMSIALGIASAAPFRVPQEGPLGLRRFWRDAIYCASLCQALINVMPFDHRPRPGLAYLGGLLHNFGTVVLGHLFPESFDRLNRALEEQPERGLDEIERELLDVGHHEVGEWLMQAWRMPGEVINAVAHHHDPHYDGVHAVYPNLVLTANRLLAAHGIGEGRVGEESPLPLEGLLERLELHREPMDRVVDELLVGRGNLDDMAARMAP